jgi:hypothetical protein
MSQSQKPRDPTAHLNKTVKDVDPKTDRAIRRRIHWLGPIGQSRLGRLAGLLVLVLLVGLVGQAVTSGGRTRRLVDSGIHQRNIAFCAQTKAQFTLEESTLTLYGFLLEVPPQPNQTPQQAEVNKQFRLKLQDNIAKIESSVTATLALRQQLGCLPPDQAPMIPHLPPLSTH